MDIIVTFDSTHGAISMESAVEEAHIKGRLIGTPESLSASCGLSLKSPEEELDAIKGIIDDLNIQEITRIYRIVPQERRQVYQEIEIEEN